MRKVLSLLLALTALLALASFASAEEADVAVIMNIPYTDFYKAELNLPDDYQVDAVTTATEKVYKNAALVGGSYAVETADGTHEIQGVSFPVRVNAALLNEAPFAQVADAEALASSTSYSYCVPETAPAYYKELTALDGAFSFGPVQNLAAADAEGVKPVLDEVKGRRGDYKLQLKGFDFSTDGKDNIVYAVVVKTADAAYPLRHLENIFGGDELAINAGSSKLIKGVNPAKPDNYTSIVGQTITEIDYYTSQGLYTFAANIELPDELDNKGYVLMNIPYAKFYEAEVTDASIIDAVSSSTLMKPRTGTLAGGSYHVDPEGTDISGVIYPVYVDDLAALAGLGGIEITDDSKVEITVTNKGETTTTAYDGKAALFEAPSYSWYVMQEGALPKQYKTLTLGDEPSFSAVNKKDKALPVEVTYIKDKHADIALQVSGAEDKLDGSDISGVVLVTEDGTRVGLRHVKNIWRKYKLGFNLDSAEYAALAGKTITEVRYITEGANYVFETYLTPGDLLMAQVNGVYEELFPVITDAAYDQLWLDNCGAIVGEENAPLFAEMLKSACMGTIYGEEAVSAYGDGSNGAQFDCFFINGIRQFDFDRGIIIGLDEDEGQVFGHGYHYVGEFSIAGVMNGYLYETEDDDAGEFKYFLLMPDTPASTWHIEFRYGSDKDALAEYAEGPYAYWLAAGILKDRDESTVENVIRLFCLENMDYSAHMDAALAQLDALGFVGAWQADLSAYGEMFAGVELTMTIDENGHGITLMNGMQTADFEAFAVDNGEKDDGAGLYVAYSNWEGEAEAAPYTLVTNENGQTVLTFYADDGVISWIKAE